MPRFVDIIVACAEPPIENPSNKGRPVARSGRSTLSANIDASLLRAHTKIALLS